MPGALDAWFKSEILAHEDILMRYLARVWPHRADLADLRQEAYARVYESAQNALPQNPKAFLFSIARHIMSDHRRRERIVSIQAAGDNDFSNDLVEEKTPERCVGAQQELVRVAQAFDRLPAKCREVVWMRRVQEIPQKECAERLHVNEKAIEKQISRGGRLLALFLKQSEAVAWDTSASRETDDGMEEEDREKDRS